MPYSTLGFHGNVRTKQSQVSVIAPTPFLHFLYLDRKMLCKDFGHVHLEEAFLVPC